MKDIFLSRSVDRREDSRQSFDLLFAAKQRNQINSLTFDRFVDLLPFFIGAEFFDCRFDDWHGCNFTIPAPTVASGKNLSLVRKL